MVTKRCSCCKLDLPTDKFNRHPRTRSGLQSNCKLCASYKMRERYKKYSKEIKVYMRQYYAHNKDKWLDYNLKPTSRVARAACAAVQRAVAKGKLTRPSLCEQCGSSGPTEAHHAHGYEAKLDVRWLCRGCRQFIVRNATHLEEVMEHKAARDKEALAAKSAIKGGFCRFCNDVVLQQCNRCGHCQGCGHSPWCEGTFVDTHVRG